MILSYANVLHFLMSVVPPNKIFAKKNNLGFQLLFADFSIDDISENNELKTRNRNIVVNAKTIFKAHLLLKQPLVFTKSHLLSIRREALFYEKICANKATIKKYKPRLSFFDPIRHILIREYGNEFICLSKVICETNFLRETGIAIANFHIALKIKDIQEKYKPFFFLGYPSPFFLINKDSQEFSSFNDDKEMLLVLELFKSFNGGLKTKILELKSLWTTEGIIHRDFRLDNILVNTGSNTSSKVWIIDWEMASLGDPAWDIAQFLKELFVYLLVPAQADSTTKKIIQIFKKFYSGYSSKLNSSTNTQFEQRVIAFCGVLLITFYLSKKNKDGDFIAIQREKLLNYGKWFIEFPEQYIDIFFKN